MAKWKYLKYFRGLYWNFTFLRPLLAGIYDTIFPSAMKFSGLGLTTRHELPWNDDYDWGAFRKASVDIKVIRYTPVSARLAPNLFSIKARAARPGSDKNPRAPDIATAVERLKPSV